MDNVTDGIKNTTQTSYFRLFILLLVAGPFLILALLWLANYALPPADADAFKKPLLEVWKWLLSATGGGVVIGGLLRTWGKIATQKEIAVTTAVSELAKQPTLENSVTPEMVEGARRTVKRVVERRRAKADNVEGQG